MLLRKQEDERQVVITRAYFVSVHQHICPLGPNYLLLLYCPPKKMHNRVRNIVFFFVTNKNIL